MKLIENWKQSALFWSMQAMAIIGAAQAVIIAAPPELQQQLPNNAMQWLTFGLALAGMVGRLVKQDLPYPQPIPAPLDPENIEIESDTERD